MLRVAQGLLVVADDHDRRALLDRPQVGHQAIDDGASQVIGRLVQDQHPRPAQQGPRDRDTLRLSSGEQGSVPADVRIVSLRQPLDEFVGQRELPNRGRFSTECLKDETTLGIERIITPGKSMLLHIGAVFAHCEGEFCGTPYVAAKSTWPPEERGFEVSPVILSGRKWLIPWSRSELSNPHRYEETVP